MKRVGHTDEGDLGGDDDALVKITFKADAETLGAIESLIKNAKWTSRVAQRRVRSEVIRRALIAAAAAVERGGPPAR